MGGALGRVVCSVPLVTCNDPDYKFFFFKLIKFTDSFLDLRLLFEDQILANLANLIYFVILFVRFY